MSPHDVYGWKSVTMKKGYCHMTTTSRMDRRAFLARSTAALTAGSQLLSTDGAASSISSISSGRIQPGEKVVGCYCSTRDVVSNPKYIDALQKTLGVNTLLCSSPVKMPDWLQAINPADNERSHRDDDTILHQAIEETHNRGMDFWQYHHANHHYYGESGRHLMSETFDGTNFLDLPPIKYSLEYLDEASICVSKPVVREYETEYFGYAAKEYDVDAVYSSHIRYANPSFWTNLLGCACPHCRKEAARMGYDFPAMRNSMVRLLHSLQNLDRKTVEHAAKTRLSFTDFLSLVGENDGVMDWFFFRANVLSNQLKRITNAVHTMSSNRSRFIIDTHPATLSILVGHNWNDFANGATDALMPLSWCGWHYISPVAAWANQLCEWVPGLEESTALRLVISLFGWDDIGLPDTRISDLRIGESADQHGSRGPAYNSFYELFNPALTTNLMTYEWTKMAALSNGRIPTLPIVKGSDWLVDVCERLMDLNEDLGLTGYIFQGTDTFIDKDRL
jgi:hypothetical protein